MTQEYRVVLNARFAMSTVRTPRVKEVAENFGIGLEDREFVLFDNVELNIKAGDVVYFTGQSGSGKSVGLRETARQLQQAGLLVANIDQLIFDVDRPIVELLGGSFNEAMQLLALGGVNDAYLAIRNYSELSDGQKYRFKLAKLLASGAKVWVADEFGAVLDRKTARAVSFTLQRAARQAGAILMVATTHTDLVEDLNPSIKIEKHYRQKVCVIHKDPITGEELSRHEVLNA